MVSQDWPADKTVLGGLTPQRSAAAHPTECGRTGDERQHGDRLPHTAWRCQQQRFVRCLPV
jgi:hypothetical protein